MSTESEYNVEMRAGKLRRKLARQQAWVDQVSAQVEQRRRAANRELQELGVELIEFARADVANMSERALADTATQPLPGTSKDDD